MPWNDVQTKVNLPDQRLARPCVVANFSPCRKRTNWERGTVLRTRYRDVQLADDKIVFDNGTLVMASVHSGPGGGVP